MRWRMICWGTKVVCISCKTTPFNPKTFSFGQKSIALFTKCRTDFEPIQTLEFTAAQIKAINSLYDYFPEILNTYL